MYDTCRGISAIAITAALVTACGGSKSGGTGGGTGTTSSDTTSTTGTGGSGGGTTGTGGSMGGGDGGTCLTCADWAAIGGSPDALCTDAMGFYDALFQCVCQTQCATECANAAPCVPGGAPSSACGDCESMKCGSQATACLSN